jgi:hypothetical protein
LLTRRLDVAETIRRVKPPLLKLRRPWDNPPYLLITRFRAFRRRRTFSVPSLLLVG